MEKSNENMLLRAGMIMLIPAYVFIIHLVIGNVWKMFGVQTLFIAAILFLSKKDDELKKIFNIKKNVSFYSICKCLVYGCISFLLGKVIVLAAGSIVVRNVYVYQDGMYNGSVVMWIAEMLIFIPVTDELLYRHIFCRDIKRMSSDKYMAIIVSALLFSLFSLDKQLFALLLPLGFLTGALQMKNDNVFLCIMAHVGFNLAYIVYCIIMN